MPSNGTPIFLYQLHSVERKLIYMLPKRSSMSSNPSRVVIRRILITFFVVMMAFISLQPALKASAGGGGDGVFAAITATSCSSVTVSGFNRDYVEHDVTVTMSGGGASGSDNTLLPGETHFTSVASSTTGAAAPGSTITVNVDDDVPEHLITYTYSCGAGVPGPAIPDGFVLRTITCNTPVYETAGGIPVPSGDKILAGQSWYVNPKPVTVGKTSWTEFFDGGYTNG